MPRAEQFGAVKQLLDEGVIAHAGLSEVSVADIKQASQVFRVATVQNAYNMAERHSDDVVDYCEANGIGFIPYYPLGGNGELARSAGLAKVARGPWRHGGTDRAGLALEALARHPAHSGQLPGSRIWKRMPLLPVSPSRTRNSPRWPAKEKARRERTRRAHLSQ